MRFSGKHIEGLIWCVALVAPAIIDAGGEAHYTFCLFSNLGITWCPGCGLGESISWLYRGEIERSFLAHPLGVPAVLVILWRIISIFFIKPSQFSNPTPHEHQNFEYDPRH